MSTKVFSSAVASAVAGLFLTTALHATDEKAAPAAAGEKAAPKEWCASTCKGKGACKGHGNECKGHNGCKGKGWLEAADAAACKTAGGTWKKK